MVSTQFWFCVCVYQGAWVLCPSEPRNWPYPRLIPSEDWKASFFFFLIFLPNSQFVFIRKMRNSGK